MLKKKISDRAKDEGILQEVLLIVVDLLKLTATQMQGYSKGKGNNHKLEKLQLFFKVSFLAENLSALVSSCLNFIASDWKLKIAFYRSKGILYCIVEGILFEGVGSKPLN